jgi:hypothetical protein
MRLIDADALVAYFERLEGDTIAVTDAAAVADNMPEVCCEQCEDRFEAQCDCELDSPGMLSHLPLDERLQHWTYWALYPDAAWDRFEAQCDCELDSPGMLSHLPLDERLQHWTYWALYLKRRIEKHYRPAIAELEHHIDGWRGKYMDMKARAEKAEAEVALRDRMLVAEYDSPTPKTAGYMRWFTDLRARAEKEAER